MPTHHTGDLNSIPNRHVFREVQKPNYGARLATYWSVFGTCTSLRLPKQKTVNFGDANVYFIPNGIPKVATGIMFQRKSH